MASSLFIRVLNPRSLYINNGTVAVLSNLGQRCAIKSCLYTTESTIAKDDLVFEGTTKKPISKAMRAYLDRAKQYNEFIKKETALYDIGKRHLANMMGKDPEMFTQQDVDKAIEYLFPSGLYEPQARPIMRPPQEIFPAQKEAEIDESGRPFHSMYYTYKPNYYEMLYNIAGKFRYLDELEDRAIKKGALPSENKIDTVQYKLLSQEDLEGLLLESLSPKEYEYYLSTMERLIDHRLSNNVQDFIKKYLKLTNLKSDAVMALPIEYDANRRGYVTVKQCMRKSARGVVTIWANGTGKISINGQDITYFEDIQHREQIVFPLLFTAMMDKVDIDATVEFGGPTGQAGAIRWGIAWGLRSFVNEKMIQRMKVAGLLTRDWRRRERKKFGQEGARRKFTWKKR